MCVFHQVDILESDIWGQQPPYKPHAAYHWSPSACFHDSSGGAAYQPPTPTYNYSTGFHTYSVEVTPRWLVFGVDGVSYYNVTQAATGSNLPHHPMYLIIGNQLWQGWSYPQELPADFVIDWVKAYTLDN